MTRENDLQTLIGELDKLAKISAKVSSLSTQINRSDIGTYMTQVRNYAASQARLLRIVITTPQEKHNDE